MSTGKREEAKVKQDKMEHEQMKQNNDGQPTLKGVSLIGFSEASTDGQADTGVIHGIDPSTNEKLQPQYHLVGEADLDRALSLAWDAFLVYRDIDAEKRAAFLEGAAEAIESLGDTLIDRAMQETGLPRARLEGERARTCGQLRLFASVLRDGKYQDLRHDAALPDRKPLPRPDLWYRKIPLGPVAVFGASNFPLAFSVAGGDTASALAAGCPVVVKAHNAHPGTAELVGRAVVAAARQHGMPDGVFSLLYGNGNALGQQLAAHPLIQAIGFTGSRGGGTALMKTAANRPVPIPVYAEMSSINPVYLMPDALKTRGAEIGQALVQSMMMGAGQFCTSPGLIFLIDGPGNDAFLDAARQALAGQGSQTMLTPGIAKAFDTGVQSLKSVSAVQQLGSSQADSSRPNQCQAQIFVVDGDTFAAEKALHAEVFGSCAVVIRCRDMAQIHDITEGLEGQLTAAIHCTDADDAQQLRSLIGQLERKVGRILFNGFGTGVEVANAMVHGGPYPATSDGRTTSVGTAAIERFLRPVCYQNVPEALRPAALKG